MKPIRILLGIVIIPITIYLFIWLLLKAISHKQVKGDEVIKVFVPVMMAGHYCTDEIHARLCDDKERIKKAHNNYNYYINKCRKFNLL